MDHRKSTAIAVTQAAEAWQKAPVHIKGMAGAYVNPLMAAVFAINEELQHQKEKREKLRGIMRALYLEKVKPNVPPELIAEFEATGMLEELDQ